jgi:hypothetical protein
MLKPWQKAFREEIAPHLSEKTLAVLRKGLDEDDPRLVQGTTVSPHPSGPIGSRGRTTPPTGACALGYCGWQGEGLNSVGDVWDFFGKFRNEVDDYALNDFVSFFDSNERHMVFAALSSEIDAVLAERLEAAVPA